MTIRATDVRIAYPGGEAMGPLSLDVERPTILTGASGSGKTTLLKALAGILPAVHPARVEGTMQVLGHAPTQIPADQRGRVAWMPQGLHSIAPTPWEEVAVGLEHARWPRRAARRRIEEALHDAGVGEAASRPMRILSGGQQARVLLAAALATEPDVLLWDEPLAQLDAAGRDWVRGVVSAHDGPALVATHHAWHGTPAIDLGGPSPTPLAPVPDTQGDVAVQVGGTVPDRITVPDVEVAAGAAVAVQGPNGSGKTTLLHAVAGLLGPGLADIHGTDPATARGPARARLVGLSFQDPAWHITQDTVDDEAAWTLRNLGMPPAPGWLERFDLAKARGAHPWDLSGGQRQRLAVVTALAHEPRVALLDEPTRGMDARHRQALRDVIAARSAAGLTTLVATHDRLLADALPRHIHLEAP